MIRLVAAVLFLCSGLAVAQTKEVKTGDLTLNVTLEEIDATPYQREMLLLTIHGIYKRHITLEKLLQPDLAGLNWMQLGQDNWFESVLDGKTVKNMRRRVAIFPEASGRIEIAPFTHHLTLLDEQNKWFEHQIQSQPISFEVAPAPDTEGWWFPVRRLQITDEWSNAPDQLASGEGILRVVRISALGASPDMIPPMPKLSSPSAMIFAHPEKRLVDLTPSGPVSIAFWRWTIQPRNGVSAILEPIEFEYFDTTLRKTINVAISAQRIAYLPSETSVASQEAMPAPVKLRSGVMVTGFLAALLISLGLLFGMNRQFSNTRIFLWFERVQLLERLRRSGEHGDLKGLRRWAMRLDKLGHSNKDRLALLARLDRQIYGGLADRFDPKQFYRDFRKTLK